MSELASDGRSEGLAARPRETGETAGAAATGPPAELAAPAGSARMRWVQVRAVFRIELRRLLLRRRALPAMALALIPVLLMAAWALVGDEWDRIGLAESSRIHAAIYRGLTVAMVIFFGCVAIFSNLVRREVRDRTLHHHLLTPVRRDLLLGAKFAAGLVAAWLIFGLSTLLTFCFSYSPYLVMDPVGLERFFLDGPGFAHLAAYLGATVLACLGYGAVFLALGMFFKNPVFPALVVYGWEIAVFLLPPALKRLSVGFYLSGLLPLPAEGGTFAILAEPPAAWLAVPGLLLLAAALVALSAWKVRRLEILYGED